MKGTTPTVLPRTYKKDSSPGFRLARAFRTRGSRPPLIHSSQLLSDPPGKFRNHLLFNEKQNPPRLLPESPHPPEGSYHTGGPTK
jgi:hypothetical protein